MKVFFKRNKTKLIFENLIFSRRDFVCWLNLHRNVLNYLNPCMSSGNKHCVKSIRIRDTEIY